MPVLILKNVICFVPDDRGGDECRLDIEMDGRRVTSLRRDMDRRQRWTINRSFEYTNNFRLRLFDEERFLSDDLIGMAQSSGPVHADHTHTHTFRGSGARYKVHYQLQPTNAFVVVRYRENGALDTTFGDDGIVMTDFLTGIDETAGGVAVDSRDRVVIGGGVRSPRDGSDRFAVARYRTDGSLDTQFARIGKVITNFFSTRREAAKALLVDSHDRIVLAGWASARVRQGQRPHGSELALARYRSDGTLDTTFDGIGKRLHDLVFDQSEVIQAVALSPMGRIIVAGRVNLRHDDRQAFVASFFEDGRLDAKFGRNGVTIFSFPECLSSEVVSVAVDDQGRIVVAGNGTRVINNQASGLFMLARFTRAGQLEAAFGDSGFVSTDFRSSQSEQAAGLILARNGRIVVAGRAEVQGETRLALARYNDAGVLDRAFNRDGKLITDFRSMPKERAIAVAEDKRGRIIAAGSATAQDGTRRIAVARYSIRGILDTTFHDDGKLLTSVRPSAGLVVAGVAVDSQNRIVVGGSL